MWGRPFPVKGYKVNKSKRFRYFTDWTWKQIIILCSISSFLILLLIAIFILREGLPAFSEIGILKFLTGTTWSEEANEFGILPMIVGKVLHNATLGLIFYYATDRASGLVSGDINFDIAAVGMVAFVLIISYQIETARRAKQAGVRPAD